VAGGKGATSRKTPQEIADAADRHSITAGERLIYASKMIAKVDSAAQPADAIAGRGVDGKERQLTLLNMVSEEAEEIRSALIGMVSKRHCAPSVFRP